MNEILTREDIIADLTNYLRIAEPHHLAFLASQYLPYQVKYNGDDLFIVENPDPNDIPY